MNKQIRIMVEQLEDAEDKLGIDLLKPLKALAYGCYYYGDNYEIKFSDDIVIGKRGIYVLLGNDKYIFLFSNNYGKTWAITKEELK